MAKYGCAPVAQWIRVSVFGTEGRRFESYPVYHRGVRARVSLGLFFVANNRVEYAQIFRSKFSL